MKKHITLTALLVAGSAFANASSTADFTKEIWAINFGTEYANGYQITGDLTNVGTVWDIVAVEGGTQTGTKRVHMQNGNFGSWDEDFKFSMSLTLGETISASNNWPVFAELLGNDTSLRFGPYIGNGNKVDLDGNLTKNSEMAAAVAPGGSYTIDLYVMTTDSGRVVEVYVDGVQASTGTLANDLTGTIDNLFLGGANYDYYKINEVVHNISWSTIPEPSAFGWLAGLGALALVGARRRRR